jgi:hypothetical protein
MADAELGRAARELPASSDCGGARTGTLGASSAAAYAASFAASFLS